MSVGLICENRSQGRLGQFILCLGQMVEGRSVISYGKIIQKFISNFDNHVTF